VTGSIIRAEGQCYAFVQERQPRIGRGGTLRAEAGLRPAHVGEQVAGLHGGDDFLALEGCDLGGRRDLCVLDAQTVVVSAVGGFDFGFARGFLRFGKGVERHLNAFVADGVEAELEAREHALFCHVVELGCFIAGQTGVLRIVGVWSEQGGGVGTEGTVHETL